MNDNVHNTRAVLVCRAERRRHVSAHRPGRPRHQPRGRNVRARLADDYGYNMFLFPMDKWNGGVFYEHRTACSRPFVGLLTTILAVWLWLKDPRKWLHWLGIAAFLGVIVQGILGGLRVRWQMDWLGIFHGAVAQTFLVLTCAIALFTSRWWQNSETEKQIAVPRGLAAMCFTSQF